MMREGNCRVLGRLSNWWFLLIEGSFKRCATSFSVLSDWNIWSWHCRICWAYNIAFRCYLCSMRVWSQSIVLFGILEDLYQSSMKCAACMHIRVVCTSNLSIHTGCYLWDWFIGGRKLCNRDNLSGESRLEAFHGKCRANIILFLIVTVLSGEAWYREAAISASWFHCSNWHWENQTGVGFVYSSWTTGQTGYLPWCFFLIGEFYYLMLMYGVRKLFRDGQRGFIRFGSVQNTGSCVRSFSLFTLMFHYTGW
jgi:hypothetical protein